MSITYALIIWTTISVTTSLTLGLFFHTGSSVPYEFGEDN
jgi:hypothetical protein